MKQQFFKIIILIFVMAVSSVLWAGNLGAPFSFDSSSVLPAGVRNVTLQGFTTQAYNKYNTDGNAEAISKALNKSVTWNDLINGQDTALAAQSLQALLTELGKDPNEIVGSTSGIINARATVTAPVLAYGINKKWTAALAVPIIYTSTNVDAGFLSNQVLNNFFGNELAAQNLSLQAESAARKFVSLLNQKAIANGYEPISNETKTRIGDVKLVNKYQIYKDPYIGVAIKQDITMPTGTPADPDKIVDVGSGDGQWDLGLGIAADYFATSYFTLTGAFSYTAQLPDTVRRHLPVSVDNTISADVDDSIYRNLGDIFSTSLGAKLTLFEVWGLSTAYAYQYKTADTYQGSVFEASRYEILEFDTHQTMHSAQLGIDFSTIPMFRKKTFPLPLSVALGYSWVLAGENVGADGLLSFRMSAFF